MHYAAPCGNLAAAASAMADCLTIVPFSAAVFEQRPSEVCHD